MQPTLSAIVVTYNTGAVVRECLQAILKSQTTHSLEVIVVDNASNDNTVEQIQTQFPQIRVIQNHDNLGFGTANNRGAESASGEYLIFINPDLVLQPEALQTLLNYLLDQPKTGIVGPRTLEADGEVAITARPDYTASRILCKYLGIDRIAPWLVYGKYKQFLPKRETPIDADWLQGSCLMIRRETFRKLGGFDEGFFLYMEDTDLCVRVREQGLGVVYIPNAIAKHYGGTTTSRFPLIRVRNYHLSPLYYYRKRHQPLSVMILKVGFTFELLGKLLIRRSINLFKYDKRRVSQAEAEQKVLLEVWRY